MDTDDPEAGLSEVHGEPKASDRVRIVVVGDSGVGKSSLVHLLCHGAVLRHAGGTVGCEIDVALHAHSGTPFFVELLEVGGADKFRLARGVFFTQPFDGVMLVHDLTNRNSLHNLERWRREIADARPAAEVAVADSSVPAGSASSSGASSGARRTHPALDGSPGPSLSRRQLSTGVPPAEEEWLDAGEMGLVPCVTIGSKLDLASRSGTGPAGGLEASMTAPTLPRAALAAFFSRVIDHAHVRGGDHRAGPARRSLFKS